MMMMMKCVILREKTESRASGHSLTSFFPPFVAVCERMSTHQEKISLTEFRLQSTCTSKTCNNLFTGWRACYLALSLTAAANKTMKEDTSSHLFLRLSRPLSLTRSSPSPSVPSRGILVKWNDERHQSSHDHLFRHKLTIKGTRRECRLSASCVRVGHQMVTCVGMAICSLIISAIWSSLVPRHMHRLTSLINQPVLQFNLMIRLAN